MAKFPLFELRSVLEIENNEIVLSITSNNGDKTLSACLLASGDILLCLTLPDMTPVIKGVHWCLNPCKKICVMSFDPTLSAILIATEDVSLYIIPLKDIIQQEFPYDWNPHSISMIYSGFRSKGIIPSDLVWWTSSLGNPVGIISTTQGDIVMVDLLSQKEVHRSWVSEGIIAMDLFSKINGGNDYLLIKGAGLSYWKLVLEDDESGYICFSQEFLESQSTNTHISKSVFNGLKRFSLEKLTEFKHKLVETRKGLMKTPDSQKKAIENKQSKSIDSEFLDVFHGHHVSPHLMNGNLCISDYDDKNTLTFYDVDLMPIPSTTFQLPDNIEKIVITDQLIFCATSHDKILVVSKSLVSKTMNETYQLSDGILQILNLEKSEKIVGLFRLPKTTADALFQQSVVESKTFNATLSNLDGCIVVTNLNYYLCLPRLSPDQLFILLAGDAKTTVIAESLAFSLQLNSKYLYEMAGDLKIACQDFGRALQLYRSAKISHATIISKLASQGMLMELQKYLELFYSTATIDLPSNQKQMLSDLYLNVLLYDILISQTESNGKWIKLKNFILTNNYYSPTKLIEGAISCFFWKLVNFLIENLGLRNEIFEKILECRPCLEMNYAWKFYEDDFNKCLTNPLFQMTLATSDQVKVHNNWVEKACSTLKIEYLYRLAQLYDPSCNDSLLYLFYTKQLDSGLLQPDQQHVFGNILHVFFLILSELKQRSDPICFHYDLVDKIRSKKLDPKLDKGNPFVHKVLSSGFSHSALLKNGMVYTWGTSNGAALGIGTEHEKGPHVRCIDYLAFLGIEVVSVSCGKNHTIALTNLGVFSWGSSKFGQLGLGHRGTEFRPRLVSELSHELVSSVCCGSYHSVACTYDNNVFTWGWGVHGQLGHGDVFDQVTPLKVLSLDSFEIKDVCAGYAHTLILTHAGKVLGFGSNKFGQLAVVGLFSSLIPLLLDLPKMDMISSSYFHCIAVSNEENEIYEWGASPQAIKLDSQTRKSKFKKNVVPTSGIELEANEDTNGRLHLESINVNLDQHKGHGGPAEKISPFSHASLKTSDISFINASIKELSCGNLHNVLLTDQHTLYIWGRNTDYQLGFGARKDVLIAPTCISTISLIEHVSCGFDFTIALSKNGEVYGWGHNDLGQLSSDPEDSPKESPYHVLNFGTSRRILHLRSTYGACREAPSILFSLPENTDSFKIIDPSSSIPNLKCSNKTLYNTKSLHLAIEHLGKFCTNKLISLFLRYRNDQALSKLYLCLEQLDNSFHHLLNALTLGYQKTLASDFATFDSGLYKDLEYVFKLYLSKTRDVVTRLKLLEQMVLFWFENEMSIESLEPLLRDTRSQLLLQLSTLFLGAPIKSTSALSSNQKELLYNSISTSFYIDLVNDLLKINKKHERNSLQKALELLTHTDGLMQTDLIHLLYDDLEDIFANRHEDGSGKCSTPSNADELIFFSCGHMFEASNFNNIIVPQFGENLRKLNLHKTHKYLFDDYVSESSFETPCPECLIKLLREE